MADFLARRWTRQPQGPVEVDRSNPLSNGLIGVYNAATGTFVGGPSRGTVSRKIYAAGVAAGDVFEGRIVPTFPAALFPTAPFTVNALVQWNGTVDYNGICGFGGSGGGGGWCVGLDNVSGSMRFTAGGIADYDSTIVPADNQPVLLGYVVGASTVRFFVDGVFRQEIAWGGSLNATSQPFRVGTANNGSADVTQWRGSIFGISLHKRALTDGAQAEIGRNLWQLLKPRRAIIYSFPSGGITIPTLSLPGVQDVTATSARPKVTLTY